MRALRYRPTRILILGVSKSGTTALYYKIKQALPKETLCFFEPSTLGFSMLRSACKDLLRRWALGDAPTILAKILPFDHRVDYRRFASFGRQILLVRDPRDRLMSALLYQTREEAIWRREDDVRALLEVIAAKERDPRGVSFRTVSETMSRLSGWDWASWRTTYRRRTIDAPLEFHASHPRLFAYRYEDMVDGRVGALEAYLGMPLPRTTTTVPRNVSRVVRTKSYGTWRDWFTPEDVEFLGPVLQPLLDRYYPETDWTLSPSPVIPAEHASEYVARIVDEVRVAAGLPRLDRSRST